MYLENEMDNEAESYFNQSLSIKRNAFALRCLSVMKQQHGDMDGAVKLMEECVSIDQCREYSEEYAELLTNTGHWEKAWNYYDTLSTELKKDERLILSVLPAACKLGKYEFLKDCYSKTFSVVREGERNYTDCYFVYQAMTEAREKGIPLTDKLIEKYRKKNSIPIEHDFRLA